MRLSGYFNEINVSVCTLPQKNRRAGNLLANHLGGAKMVSPLSRKLYACPTIDPEAAQGTPTPRSLPRRARPISGT